MVKQSRRYSNHKSQHLTLPELDQSKTSVMNTLGSLQSRRSYQHAIEEFIAWYCSEPRLALNRIVVLRYREGFVFSSRCPLERDEDTAGVPRDAMCIWLRIGLCAAEPFHHLDDPLVEAFEDRSHSDEQSPDSPPLPFMSLYFFRLIQPD
jgi:hypothetical protein